MNRFHTSCHTLTLDKYINCVVDQDYASLIIEGEPSLEELREAWSKIHSEFLDLAKDSVNTALLKQQYSLEALYVKIDLITNVLDLMRSYYSPELAQVLKANGILAKLNPDNESEYFKELDKAEKKVKSWIVRYNTGKASLNSAGSTEKDVDRNYFNENLTVLSKFNGYEINEKSITVAKYATILNLYQQFANEIKNKSDGGR